MGNIRYLIYKGTKAKTLENGKEYTYKDFAAEANVSYRCMTSRLSKKGYVCDDDLQPLNSHKIPKMWRNTPDYKQTRFEHYTEILSDKMLRRKL